MLGWVRLPHASAKISWQLAVGGHMKEKELFSVSLRVIGLLSLARGFNDLLFVFAREVGWFDSSVASSKFDTNTLFGIVFFFGGLYLLRGGRLVVDFAFPNNKDETEQKDEIEQ